MMWKLMAAFPASRGVPFLTAETEASTADEALDLFQHDLAQKMQAALRKAGQEGVTEIICAAFPPGYKAGDKATLARSIPLVTLPE